MQNSHEALETAVDLFNSAATELQKTEFPRPKAPNEWQRIHQARHGRNYNKLLDAVAPLAHAFVAAAEGDRSRAGAKLNSDALFILKTFASYMPILAVRWQAPELIRLGLTALTMVGAEGDVRDSVFYLAALHYSAVKLGVDPVKLFSDLSTLAPSTSLREEMRSFPLRPPGTRDLGAFRLCEVLTDGQFDLIQDTGESAKS